MNIIKTIKEKTTKITSDYLINNGWFGKINPYHTINHKLINNKLIDYVYCHKKTMGMPSGIPCHCYLMYKEFNKYYLIDFTLNTLTEIKSIYQLNNIVKSI